MLEYVAIPGPKSVWKRLQGVQRACGRVSGFARPPPESNRFPRLQMYLLGTKKWTNLDFEVLPNEHELMIAVLLVYSLSLTTTKSVQNAWECSQKRSDSRYSKLLKILQNKNRKKIENLRSGPAVWVLDWCGATGTGFIQLLSRVESDRRTLERFLI